MSKNSWQRSMYDSMLAEQTLNSEALKKKAHDEVGFLLSFLGPSPGAKILDIPCGTGRHASLLASKGFNVTGIDISPACLEIAKKQQPLPNLHYEEGDMRDLSKFYEQFDYVLNLFSSFGYFDTDHENEQVMAELIKSLKPGGKLVLNLIDRDYLLSIYKPAFWFRSGPLLQVSAGNYNPETFYNESYMTLKDETTGETTLSYHKIRLYTPQEILDLMKQQGLVDLHLLGDFTGAPFTSLSSSHPIIVGTKAESGLSRR